jgi:hypothetical protein
MDEVRARFLEMGFSRERLSTFMNRLGKADYLMLEQDCRDDDTDDERVYLDVVMSYDGENPRKIVWESIPVDVDLEGDYLTEESEDFIIHVFCPLVERVATQVRLLDIRLDIYLLEPRIVNAILR